MKIFYQYLLFILSLSSFAIAQQNVSLDSSFGNNGVVISNVTSSGQCMMRTDNNQNILLSDLNSVIKFNPAGIRDYSFANQGVFSFDISNMTDYCQTMMNQTDNKILLGGYSYNSSVQGDSSFISIIRLKNNGSLDSSFGTYGKFQFGLNPILCGAISMGLQTDGKIIAAGKYANFGPTQVFAIRVTPSGLLDTTFGVNGVFVYQPNPLHNSDQVTCSLIQPDQKILIGFMSLNLDSNNQVFGLMRLTPDGFLDNSFGEGGVVKTDIPTMSIFDYKNDYPKAISIQNDGKIILAGSTDAGRTMAICRYNPDGSLDQSFGNNGINTYNISTGYDAINGITVSGDAKIICVGQIDQNACLIRLSPVGKIDSTFNSTGIVTYGNSIDEYFTNGILQEENKIIVSGVLKNNNLISRMGLVAYNFELFSSLDEISPYRQFTIFPNPIKDKLNISTELFDDENLTLDIFDLSGRNIQQIKKGQLARGKHYISIDSKEWQAGVYLIKVSSEGRTIGNKKIIKM